MDGEFMQTINHLILAQRKPFALYEKDVSENLLHTEFFRLTDIILADIMPLNGGGGRR